MEEQNPVLLNLWKHHLGFIIGNIVKTKSEADLEIIRTNLLKIGGSQMDLYIGSLTPENILDQVYSFIQSNQLTTKENYQSWLSSDSGKEYSQFSLSDKSDWTFRLGNEEDKFVHIHPSRYSPNTIRIKATVLKTAILVFSFLNFKNGSYIDINLINRLRKEYLEESPLKTVEFKKGLGKFLDFLYKQIELRTETFLIHRKIDLTNG
ncbi:MAG: hypothetical protein C4539_03170 [Ignavibacteriales bacterium]|nr:MAG: hypothetical protein C4539_03170 [Ignavibacteriales bacterium]